ncbi:MAG: PEP-CTERM sorting domain-containing protein [Betaproteobacteria bacterium]|nr:PEP-CTERM sorting domain-containing protein [Betaproteobacteria bacterium]
MNNLKLKPLAVAVSLLAGSVLAANASAAVNVIDANPYVFVSPLEAAGAAIEDAFTFSVGAQPMSFTVSVTSLNNSIGATSILGISDGMIDLVKSDGGGGFTVVAPAASWGSDMAFNNLTTGDYGFRVTGTASGAAGGLYSFASQAALVPEPGTWAMLATGGVLLGFGLRRKGKA